jgi:hypothetical protein
MQKHIGVILLISLLGSAPCVARVEHTLSYTKTQSFNTALRFLRVDSGYTITEKDSESGYLMFEYPSEGSSKTTSGSVEIIERESSVALIVQLPQMPHHHERMLAAGLMKKLQDDYGAPPRAKAKPDSQDPPPDNDAPPSKEKEKLPSPPVQRAP